MRTSTNVSELSQYDYKLPRELIAQHPLQNRADARLMVVDRRSASIRHQHVRDLPEILAPGDCLVLNDTRVVPARLLGVRTATRARWQGLFLSVDESGHLRLLSKCRAKLKAPESITLIDRAGREDSRLWLLEKGADGIWTAHADPEEDAFALLERVGRVPLPLYIRKGEMLPADVGQYQTVYARQPGSAAAPTAGLHFSSPLLARLRESGIDLAYVTLHVGLGTFRPIETESLDEHPMHSEWAAIDQAAIERITASRAAGRRVVAVGTTTTRVLETAASNGPLHPYCGETNLFIRPPYEFRAVDALLTNFHLPRSTLLVLVRTFGGDELIVRAYEEAVAAQYRFYSYGDAMLVL